MKGARIMNEYISPAGDNWDEVRKELFSPEEIAASDLRVALIGEIIKARNEKGISQKQLEELSGVKQPVIARMEHGNTVPQIDTILKVLVPLGKTLAVVPMKK
jgi:ribosome-binding protein aMBF1 (putative translation factor)